MSSLHADFKASPLGWLVWCGYRKTWATVTDNKCAGCGTDVSERLVPA